LAAWAACVGNSRQQASLSSSHGSDGSPASQPSPAWLAPAHLPPTSFCSAGTRQLVREPTVMWSILWPPSWPAFLPHLRCSVSGGLGGDWLTPLAQRVDCACVVLAVSLPASPTRSRHSTNSHPRTGHETSSRPQTWMHQRQPPLPCQ
jgi:hypothetical protein